MTTLLLINALLIFVWSLDHAFNAGHGKIKGPLDRVSRECQRLGSIVTGVCSVKMLQSALDPYSAVSWELVALSTGISINALGTLLYCRLKKSIFYRRKMLDKAG